MDAKLFVFSGLLFSQVNSFTIAGGGEWGGLITHRLNDARISGPWGGWVSLAFGKEQEKRFKWGVLWKWNYWETWSYEPPFNNPIHYERIEESFLVPQFYCTSGDYKMILTFPPSLLSL